MNNTQQTEAVTARTRSGSGRWLLMDKLGPVGALIAAAAAPCCFPLLATAGAALGLGALHSLRGYVSYTIQAMVILSVFGSLAACRRHRQRGPLAVGVAAAVLVFFAYYAYYHVALIYAGLLALVVAAIWNAIAQRRFAACCRETP